MSGLIAMSTDSIMCNDRLLENASGVGGVWLGDLRDLYPKITSVNASPKVRQAWLVFDALRTRRLQKWEFEPCRQPYKEASCPR